MKLEFWSGIGTLTFYRNGINCGEAFNNLTGTFYPALSMFYGEVRIVDPRNSTSSEKEWWINKSICQYNDILIKFQILNAG